MAYEALKKRALNKVAKIEAQALGSHVFSCWADYEWGGFNKTPEFLGFFKTKAEAEAFMQWYANSPQRVGSAGVMREIAANGKKLNSWKGYFPPKTYNVTVTYPEKW